LTIVDLPAPVGPTTATVLPGVLDDDGRPTPDVERQMDAMREAHHGAVFRLLGQDLEKRLTVEHLSDELSALADAVLERGGEVTGVLPQFLADRELAHHGLTTLHTVASMHERKAMMADLADGFIALPGGIGTLEELFEIWTWAMLGQHRKPVALLNARDYYGKLLAFMNHVTTEGFLQQANRDMLLVDDDPARLLDAMRRYQPPVTGRWMPKEGT